MAKEGKDQTQDPTCCIGMYSYGTIRHFPIHNLIMGV
jgi:hypothetical protein